MAPRYMPRFRRKPEFNWIGDPVPENKRKVANFENYTGFHLGSISVEVGDFVIVKNEQFEQALDGEVARIDSLFENKNKDDPFRVKVTWLCRPKELPQKLTSDDFVEQSCPPLDDRLDVILESRRYENEISAESIILKCKVYSEPITTDPELFIKSRPSTSEHQYVLRYKMINLKKNSFKLVPYQNEEEESPLKISRNRTPFKERSRNIIENHLRSEKSPSIVQVAKLRITKEQLEDITKNLSKDSDEENDEDIADAVKRKRRRVSSRGGSREQTPVKRLKKSSSVQNSPVASKVVAQLSSPSTTRTSRSSRSGSTQNTPVLGSIQNRSVGSTKNTPLTADPRPTRTRKQSESTEMEVDTPKRTGSSRRSSLAQQETALANEKKKRETPAKVTSANEKKKSETPARVANIKSSKGFTEVTAQTGSGRKIKITCGDKSQKISRSAGLGNDAISSLLDSCSDEEFEEEVTPPSKKSSSQQQPNKGASTAKSAKVGKKEATKITKEPAPKQRTRRASMSIVEKPTTTPVTKNKRRSVAVSETKVKSRKKFDDSDSNSDFEVDSDDNDDKESSDSEDDFVPTKKKQVQRKKVASPEKPQKSLLDRKGFKPGVQHRSKPVPDSVNPLVEAQARLHVSAVPDQLPCREDEFAEVLSYVEGKLEEGTGGCIYISGVPGTGKTATVKQVMRYMQDNSEEYPEFNFHELNGMRLTCPEQIYVEMWRMLSGGEKLSAEAALKRLDARFSQPAPKRVPTVFLVDELDMLCKRKQTVLYNIFEWPSRVQAKLIIIAIANTMDLPERDMDMRVISRLGFNRLNFEPYKQDQLQIIVSSRLEGLEVFQSDEIQLVSRKVASLSGDARRALDICRILAERCEREGKSRVTHVEVLQVHKEMFTSPKILFIRSCSHLEQLLLKSMVNEFYRTGVEETNIRNISHRMMELCKTEGKDNPTLFCLYDLCARLSSQRLILAEDYRKGLDTKLRLNVGFEDVNFALRPRQPLD